MASAIDDNAADGNLDKWNMLIITVNHTKYLWQYNNYQNGEYMKSASLQQKKGDPEFYCKEALVFLFNQLTEMQASLAAKWLP